MGLDAFLAGISETPKPSTAPVLALVRTGLTHAQGVVARGIYAAMGTHAAATLSGYAGTGKTYLVAHMVTDWVKRGKAVAVSAPTNKAVSVLAQKLGRIAGQVHCASIHSLLGLKLTTREDGTQVCVPDGASTLRDYDVIVVDEVSMLDADLFLRIRSERGSAFILFVGDPAQLPPAADGLAQSPAFDDSPGIAQVRLTEIVRQGAGNPIIALSMAVRESAGRFPVSRLRDYADGQHIRMIPRSDIVTVASNYDPEDTRILAWKNQTVLRYNAALHGLAYPGADVPFCPGERFIVHEGCESAEGILLMNSAEGAVGDVSTQAHPQWATIPAYRVTLTLDGGVRATGYIPVDADRLNTQIGQCWQKWREAKAADDHAERRKWSATAIRLKRSYLPLRHAYASTTHKAQGSTFNTAIVDVSDLSGTRDATQFNKIIYTAITRPSSSLILAI
jgi:exodeoxyribonuclease-5